jgi:hypothetical protein
VKKLAYLRSILVCASIACGALSIQHFWVAHPSGPGAGLAGVTATVLRPVRTIPDAVFDITKGESKLGYVRRVTDMVHLTTYHCEAADYHLSLLDRLFLWLSGNPSTFAEGILVKDRFTCGFCHQRAFLVHQILQRNGIKSDVFGLNGHVVTRADIDGRLFYTDPDYGVGPFPTATENIDQAVRENYSMAPQGNLDLLASLYSSEDDNLSYGDYIDTAYSRQASVFKKSNILAYSLLLASFILLTCWAVLYRRNKSRRPSRYLVNAN